MGYCRSERQLLLDFLEDVKLRLVLLLLQLFLVAVELQGVGKLNTTIDKHTPAEEVHRRLKRGYRLDHHIDAEKQDECWHDPESKADAAIAATCNQGKILVDGTEDEHDADDIHQSRDKGSGSQGQNESENDTANADNGEGWLLTGHETALGIVDLIVADVATGMDVGEYRDEARHEKQYADGYGDASDGVVWINDEQGADDDGAKGTENGTTEYLHH